MASSAQGKGAPLPTWFPILRIAQGGLSLLILILSAVAAHKYLGGLDPTYLVTPFPSFGFTWFAFAWTVVYIPLSIFVIPKLRPALRPLVMLLTLDGFSTLWWLVAFALLAEDSRKLGILLDGVALAYGSDSEVYDQSKLMVDLTRACAGLGAGEFVLFAVGLGFVIATVLRKDKSRDAEFALPNAAVVDVYEYPKNVTMQSNTGGNPIPPPPGVELSAGRYP